jgi:hypothetical protein
VSADDVTTAAEAFLAGHGEALAHNLGHDCWRAAEDICRSMAEAGQLPAGVTPERTLQVILSLRATLELMAVEHRFGTPAHDRLLAAMDDYYSRTLLRSGRFTTWIAAAHETMRRSADPRQWMTIHAMQLLHTTEPAAATFHLALGYGLRAGASIATVVAANTEPAEES